jgi:FkbM family methyltransferase
LQPLLVARAKILIKQVFRRAGLDVFRLSGSPKETLLGLRGLPVGTVIDVGANKGQFARYIAGIFPNANICSFEPLPEAFAELKKWAESENGRVKAFNLALGESEGSVDLYRHLDHSPSSSLLRSTAAFEVLYPIIRRQEAVSVEVATLDRMVAKGSIALRPEIFIKLDVQGYEHQVIRGGIDTFKSAVACLVEVNVDSLYENQARFQDLVGTLAELGYRYVGNLEQTYARDGHVIFLDAVFSRKITSNNGSAAAKR